MANKTTKALRTQRYTKGYMAVVLLYKNQQNSNTLVPLSALSALVVVF